MFKACLFACFQVFCVNCIKTQCTPDSIRYPIRMQTADLQVPTNFVGMGTIGLCMVYLHSLLSLLNFPLSQIAI